VVVGFGEGIGPAKCVVLLHLSLSPGRNMNDVQFITSLKSNLRTALNRYDTTANNTIILQAQDTTALESGVCLTRRHQLLLMHILGLTSPCATAFTGSKVKAVLVSKRLYLEQSCKVIRVSTASLESSVCRI
jgi:hypothetical protein